VAISFRRRPCAASKNAPQVAHPRPDRSRCIRLLPDQERGGLGTRSLQMAQRIQRPSSQKGARCVQAVALVPKPRVNLTRFHGVFARGGLPPNSKFRVRVTPAKRGRGRKRRQRQPTGENWLDKTPAERHQSMTWMQRLKRVFNIDIETCERCKGLANNISSSSLNSKGFSSRCRILAVICAISISFAASASAS